MATAMRVFRKFQSSDGRIKVATLSGVSALVAVIALLVGVLPVMAHENGTGLHDVHPVVVSYGGGSGACSATLTADGVERLPSAASKEFHINNPQAGNTYTQDGITVTVRDRSEPLPAGTVFDFVVAEESDFIVYDVVVNGGPQNNHYDYDGNGGPGTVDEDTTLHAPRKNKNSLHNLSHINLCYDVPGVTFFACDADPVTLTEEEGFLTVAETSIFANSEVDCTNKRGSFLIEDDTVTLDFGTDDGGVVAGRLDITKDFTQDDTPSNPTDFENLEYNGPGDFVDLQWCAVDTPKAEGDGGEFDDVLADDEYPSLDGVTDDFEGAPAATACKVSEEENAAGVQHTVVYFEFVDPQFR